MQDNVLKEQIQQDEVYMRKALALAETARGRTNPNPMVGALIVKDGVIVGEGWHHKAGTPHAEVHALRMAGEQAKGADIYVTLEPCSHYGKTPPCADAVVKAGLKRAVIAMQDPNPLVAGHGIEKLRSAGIEVKVGVCEQEAKALNEVFLKYIQTKRPFTVLKTAMTLDGKIATCSGKSQWISNAESRQYVHQLRDEYDGIVTGIGTVLKDNPMLNTRLENGEGHDPVRIILDSSLRIPEESRIVQTARNQRTIIACAPNPDASVKKVLEEAGIEILEIPQTEYGLDLDVLMQELGKKEICSLLIEGGSQLDASFLEAKQVDKVYWFIAPKIFGGTTAPGPIGGIGIDAVEQAVQIENSTYKFFGGDICMIGYPKYKK